MVRGLFALAAFVFSTVTLAQVSVEVDRKQIRVDESFGVYFSYEGDAEVDPDFGELEQDFDILGSNRQNTLQIINGRALSRQSWALTLAPERAGRLVIPSVRFADVESDPVEIMVEELDQGADAGPAEIFIEVSLEPDTVYVQQEALLIVRLYLAVPVSNATLTDPEVGAGDAVIEKLGDGRSYDDEREGLEYTVVERRYAVYPQRSGTLEIDPVVFSGETRSRNYRGRYRRVRSDALTLSVRAVPPSVDASRWLPARALELSESWSDEPPEFRVGEPVTRTLTVKADGLTAAQLPGIDAPIPDGLREYPDQPVLEDRAGEGLSGVRIERSALVPTRPGVITLPAITLDWWNTETGRAEQARIPERRVQVLSGSATKAAPTGAPAAEALTRPETEHSAAGKPSYWPWLSAALALGWGLTVLAWVFTRARSRDPDAQRHVAESISKRAARRALRNACRSRDPHAARVALLDWERACRQDSRSSWHPSPELAAEIRRLDRAVYGPDASNSLDWDGERLWKLFEQAGRSRPDRAAGSTAPLEPLHY